MRVCVEGGHAGGEFFGISVELVGSATENPRSPGHTSGTERGVGHGDDPPERQFAPTVALRVQFGKCEK